MRFSVKKVTLSSFFPPKLFLSVGTFCNYQYLKVFFLFEYIYFKSINKSNYAQWVDNKRTDQICSSWGRPELILYTAWSGFPEFQSGSYTPDQNIFPPWLESSHNPLHLHCYRNWVYFLGCPAKEKSLSIFHFSEIIYSIQYKWFQFDLIKLNWKLCFALLKCKQKNVCILRMFLLPQFGKLLLN